MHPALALPRCAGKPSVRRVVVRLDPDDVAPSSARPQGLRHRAADSLMNLKAPASMPAYDRCKSNASFNESTVRGGPRGQIFQDILHQDDDLAVRRIDARIHRVRDGRGGGAEGPPSRRL